MSGPVLRRSASSKVGTAGAIRVEGRPDEDLEPLPLLAGFVAPLPVVAPPRPAGVATGAAV